jgi:tRNA threonylcarbamoyladenosine biosynthesis protein TsaB
LRIVAFDTTSRTGSIALFDDGQLLVEVTMESPDGFSHVLFGELEAVLARHGWSISEIDAIAAAAGPGSFTGVRVSLAAVKGLAEAAAKPVFAVSNLQAGAALGTSAVRAPWIDARRGEVYGGLYSAELKALGEERVMAFDAWRAALPDGAELIAVDGRLLAGAIARIAAARYAGGEPGAPELVDANYVRRSDAELFWRDPA